MGKQPHNGNHAQADEQSLRQEIVETALAMSREGLSPGRSGNVSARVRGGMLITPTGVTYDTLCEESIVFVAQDGEIRAGSLKPSSEWQMHLAVYGERPGAGAVVHCHSLNATALACAEKPIPAFHYMVAVAGGADIPLVPYATFGTPALAENVAMALKDRQAALLSHHGQIAFASNLVKALELAREVETLAAQYCRVLQIGGGTRLDDAEIGRVLKKFGRYGQQDPAD